MCIFTDNKELRLFFFILLLFDSQKKKMQFFRFPCDKLKLPEHKDFSSTMRSLVILPSILDNSLKLTHRTNISHYLWEFLQFESTTDNYFILFHTHIDFIIYYCLYLPPPLIYLSFCQKALDLYDTLQWKFWVVDRFSQQSTNVGFEIVLILSNVPNMIKDIKKVKRSVYVFYKFCQNQSYNMIQQICSLKYVYEYICTIIECTFFWELWFLSADIKDRLLNFCVNIHMTTDHLLIYNSLCSSVFLLFSLIPWICFAAPLI